MTIRKWRLFTALLFALLALQVGACGNNNGSGGSSSDCPLPFPFCGGSFPLNTQQTTQYGPPWANVVLTTSDWIPCFGPYALCFYAECEYSEGSDGTVANCPCFEAFGMNFVDINAILNEDVYNETVAFCASNPSACQQPNQAPVCQSIISGDFMEGASRFSTFSFYRASQQPIGETDCTSQPGMYAGCMTGPCFGEGTPGEDGTTMITCQCPTYDGPFQLGMDNLACDASPQVDSAAYNLITIPSGGSKCDMIDGCIPDAPEEDCGCGLYQPGVTALPPDSGVDCGKVCEEYNSCRNSNKVELGYTCDATLCTSTSTALDVAACDGLQNCDLSEIFKAESAAQCSCCASQLCGCDANSVTNQKITILNNQQRANGDTPQCDINGTLCGN